ncbi:MAG: Ppx/GppA family phosphatase [Devosiaceae bacterium]|nr:Ppx/GppA family phosphatase [Devosiaceae bacterium]
MILRRESGTAEQAMGRLAGVGPIGVLDIGSNSVRLVIYEHHARTLTPLFNEKAACALGRGVASTGLIADKNAELALKAIARFGLVTKLMEVPVVHVLATSAVREAANGAAFLAQVELLMEAKGHVLSGEEEGYFAARGIISGMPDFSGLVGDLGGGSLEFASVEKGKASRGETFGLGVIRLQDESEMQPEGAAKIAAKRLKKSKLLARCKCEVFCAIGGTWRAFAELMQAQENYPLHMVQGYEVKAKDALNLAKKLVKGAEDVDGIETVSRARRELLAYGAAALIGVLEGAKFKRVVFSSQGVREGYLFELLKPEEAALDPLIDACEEICFLRSRSATHALELEAFTQGFLLALGQSENKSQRRLRIASCLLSDIGWRGHRDYRGEQSVDLIAYNSLLGIDHAGRAFMAEVLAVRYMGLKHESSSIALNTLMGEKAHEYARTLGALLRLAYVLSGAMPQILPEIEFEVNERALNLILPGELSFLASLRLQSRLSQLAKHLGRNDSAIVVR